MRAICDIHYDAAKIKGAPTTRFVNLFVIARASFMATRTVIHMPCIGTGIDHDVNNAIPVCKKMLIIYNNALDI